MIGYLWSNLEKDTFMGQFFGHEEEGIDYSVQVDPIQFSKITPPTSFQLNVFTAPSQEVVDMYGIPSYKEINPALFTTVTFPFLFGMMFGDIGHGFMLTLGTLGLFAQGYFSEKEPDSPVYKARYLMLLMGFFAMYSGLMYNDFVSIPLNLFGTCYDI